jgi:thiol-disulfide isomerase/thioredoxin
MKHILILLIVIFGLGSRAFGQNDHVKISGTSSMFKDGDDVTLTVYDHAGLADWPEFRHEYKSTLKDHAYSFDVLCPDSIAYIDLELRGDKRGMAYNLFIVTPGDQVHITEKDNKLTFSGTAAAAFKLHYDLINDEVATLGKADRDFSPAVVRSNFAILDSAAIRCAALVESQKTALPPNIYRLMKLDVLIGNEWFKRYRLNYYGAAYRDSVNNPYAKAYLDYKASRGSKPIYIKTDEASAYYSPFFTEMVYEKYIIDSCVIPFKKFSVHDCYRFESGHYSGPLREEMVTYLFFRRRHSAEDFSQDIKDALTYMKIPEFRKELENLLATDSVGAPAYNFNLKDDHNNPVSLAAFRGKVVVLDFWFTGCGACRLLAPRLIQLEKQFEKQNVIFISINADKSRDTWLQSLKGTTYASPLSVNLNTGPLGFGDPVIHKFDVQGYPTVVLIDKAGKIAESPGSPNLDHAKRLEQLINKYLEN